MDVAEQALTALEMLSRRHGKAILQCVSTYMAINEGQEKWHGTKYNVDGMDTSID